MKGINTRHKETDRSDSHCMEMQLMATDAQSCDIYSICGV